MGAPDKSTFYGTLILLVVPVVLFLVFVATPMAFVWHPLLIVVPSYIAIVDVVVLCITSAMDPGVIPRGPPREPPDPAKREIVINKQTVTCRYCLTCHIYRPPRASHCSDCDRCVEKFDHHCPWVGNCVGKRNYRFFCLFLYTTTLLCTCALLTSLVHIILLLRENNSFTDVALQNPITVVIILYTFLMFWSVAGLGAYHLYLVGSAMTTHEDMKSTFYRHANPYSQGICRNFASVYSSPFFPRRRAERDGNHGLRKAHLDLESETTPLNHVPED